MRDTLGRIFGVALLLAMGTTLASASSIQAIPTDSRIYDDFDRLRTSGLIHSTLPQSRPWTRGVAVALLEEADSLSRGRRLSVGLQAAMDRLRYEFRDESKPVRSGPPGRRPVLTVPVPGEVDRATCDLYTTGFVSRYRRAVGGGVVFANEPGTRFAFYDRFKLTWVDPDSVVRWDSTGLHVPGTRVNTWPSDASFPGSVMLQIEHAYLAFRVPWLRLEVGRDGFFWGPGYISSVMLSEKAPTLDHIQLCADYQDFKFLAFTSYLSRWDRRPRFLSAQRVEVSLWDRVTLGGAMMSVTSWDSVQPFSLGGLINPLVPIYLTEANSNMVGNLLLGWDAVAYLPSTKVYGQLLVDNFEFNNRRDAPNAVGLQAGAFWAPNLPVEARLEYSRVTAFTYFHRKHYIMYENYLVPLGHEIGPDADQLYVVVRSAVQGTLLLGLWGDFTRRGYYNRGDFLRKAFCFGEPLPEQFPALGVDPVTGDTLAEDWEVDNAMRVGPEFEWRPLRDLTIKGTAYYRHSINHLGLPGNTVHGWEAELKVEYRYY